MGPTIVFRTTSARVYAVITWAVAAVVLAALGANGGIGEVVRYGAIPLAMAVFGWAVFWRPSVEVGDDGVVLTNVLRTVEVPWGAIDRVETRWGLRLVTSRGAVNGWAAPARAGVGRARSQRRAEHLPDRLFEGTGRVRHPGDAAAVGAVVEDRRARRAARASAGAPPHAAERAVGAPDAGARGADAPQARVNTVVVVLLGGTIALAVLAVAL
ncbi:PH domain-containing protein [Georgenia ruanii]|uniref:PH domain-containing protein n=1 Tax=Georgenia ruanii TaxID=348442 RepID=UPI0012654DD1|nr:PH domain-containing protein [Georgenia ruanii]